MQHDPRQPGKDADAELFRLLVENVGDYAIFVVDLQGNVQNWNAGAERLLGYREEEIIGQPADLFFTPEDVAADVPRHEVLAALEEGSGNDDRWHIRKDGSRFWAGGMMTALRDEAGQVRGFAKIMRDRTEWKLQQASAEALQQQAELELRQSEARNRAILDTALDCIITIDHLGFIVDFNPAAERTFGYRRADVINREFASLMLPGLQERHPESFVAYLTAAERSAHGQRVELPALRKDGTQFPVELAIRPIPTDGSPMYTAYVRDITDQVRAEQLRNARFAVTQYLSQAADLASAASGVLRAVGESLHWEGGCYWTVNPESDLLECLATWHVPDVPLADFMRASSRRTFRRGEGLPGRVWSSGEPAWMRDIGAVDVPRASSAADHGLRSAFACPVALGEVTLGVLEFFTQDLREADSALLETMGTIAGHVAQFAERRHVEEALRESENRFRALMEQAPFSVQVFRPDGRTVTINRAWTTLWGATFDQLAKYNVLEDPQLEATGVLPVLQRAFSGEAVDLPEIRYNAKASLPDRTEDDPMRWISAVAYPLKDDGGRVREVVLVHQDITARRQAEAALRESEEKLRLVADTIPQLAWMGRADGHIIWYNRRWFEYTGTTTEEMEGWGWQAAHDPDVVPQVLERWRASLASGEPFEMVHPLRGADGVYRPFLTRVNPLRGPDGRVIYWFGTNTDISGIKRMEEALLDADRRKDEFLATLAHELRNPLAPIRSSLQILKMPRLDAETAHQTREVMERQVHHLVRLVDDLLDVSRVMRGKIELRREPVELANVVARAVETAQPLIDMRGHQLELSLPTDSLVVNADPVRLAQVVGNLLTNAAKYTEANGRISVSARREDGHAVLRVSDTGIGITPELLPHVFDLFVQADHASRGSQGGLGIGLTLVKNLLEMHNGTIEARSAGVGHGSEFTMRLPVLAARHDDAPAADDAIRVPSFSGHRILVVDDNVDAADSLAMLLRLQGHDAQVAYDGASAIDVAVAYHPSVMFLDLGMPVIDGYEVARRLRSTAGFEHVVIAALTGWGQREDRRRTAEAGFDHHLVKPLESRQLDDLLATVSHAEG